MTTIVRRLPWPAEGGMVPPAAVWAEIAAQTGDWLAAQAIDLRDAIVLLPYAQLLPLARAAFGRGSVWLPRIETTRTLAASLGPPPAAEPGQVSFDATLDGLIARQLLRSRRWGEAWARREPRGFDRAVASVVATAQAMVRAAAAIPPGARADYWAEARSALPPLQGPGETERLLVLVALEWASLAPAPASDRLFDLRPRAWVAVQAGGPDRLTLSLLAAASVSSLVLDADADLPVAAAGWPAAATPPALAVVPGFEAEAQSAAAQVLAHLRRREAPVALIAQDRLLVRRIRALLEREAVTIDDETGWKLSTTRAAALVMALLRAARPGAGSDALLDCFKALPGRGAGFSAALDAFERRLRRGPLTHVEAVAAAFAPPPHRTLDADDRAAGDPDGAHRVETSEAGTAAERLWASEGPILQRLRGSGRRSLADWIDALRQALIDSHAWPVLLRDDAGRGVVACLHLLPSGVHGQAWAAATRDVVLGLSGFSDWVDRALEDASFSPPRAADLDAEVVITPLPRALLRPFAAVVLPGADERHLCGSPAPDGLLGDAASRALGVPDSAARRQAERLAFGQLLRAPRITLLRRTLDGSEPLAASSLVLRLEMALEQAGSRWTPWRDPRRARQVPASPVPPTAPAAADRLPGRLSASACEALRACPYRFFALHLLRLGEDAELDGELEKRDYGNWLHAVLLAFHQRRGEPAEADTEVARLLAIGEEVRSGQGMPAGDFLPWAASFASLAPRYIAWLHERDRAGWRWAGGEVEHLVEPEGFGGIALKGIIDRIDQRDGGQGEDEAAIELIDYKTGAASRFKAQLEDPLEDTQLAFYAALMPPGRPVQASYLALDGRGVIERLPHPAVEASAAALRTGLAQDLQRIRDGHGLPPLGAEAACDHCAARGICRRDHWSATEDGR